MRSGGHTRGKLGQFQVVEAAPLDASSIASRSASTYDQLQMRRGQLWLLFAIPVCRRLGFREP